MIQRMMLAYFGNHVGTIVGSLRDEQIMIRESICGSFPPREVGWGGIWDQFLENMLVNK